MLLTPFWGYALAAILLGLLGATGLTEASEPTGETGTAPTPVAEGTSGAGRHAPNIVVIVTDDQRRTINRHTMPQTVRHIARRGTRFKESFVTTPVCCPSRATLLTGQYGHNNGVLSNHQGYEQLRDKDNVLPTWLGRAGYSTAHVGKFLNGYVDAVGSSTEVAPGWDHWFTQLPPRTYYDHTVAIDGGAVAFGSAKGDHLTRVLSRRATTLVQELAPSPRPFYLQLDHFAPHREWDEATTPGRCSGHARPAHGHRKLFLREPLIKPNSFNERNVSDKPSFIRSLPRLNARRKRISQRAQRCALAALRSVDAGVRKLVEALRDAGELQRTAIIVTSDNGILYGEHRIARNKGLPYEEAIRVPLAIRVPKRFLDGELTDVSSEPVANIDLAPTILELAGADPCRAAGDCRTLDGRSMLGLLGDGADSWPHKRAVVIEYSLVGAPSKYGTCAYSGLRTPSHSYVHHSAAAARGEACQSIDETELYDLRADPLQLHNRFPATNDEDAHRAASLAARHAAIADCSGISGRDAEPIGPKRHCE